MKVRFAPSPTGALHIGGARTALYNWLLARGPAYGDGEMLLRIEDTDRERSTPENVEQIFDALRWLELDWDGDPIFQSQRADRHREALEQLLASGHAYHSNATADDVRAFKERHGDDKGFRGEAEDSGAVRLRVGEGEPLRVDDLIRGETTFAREHMDDPVIARADGSVLYNFAVAVDDLDAGITHVVRGEDHLSNTPKQLVVLEALGAKPPAYAHLPLLHGPDGKKLSKRHGAASVQELRDAGYLPEAVRNYLALLGWGHEDDTKLSTDELRRLFRIEDVSRNPARFDETKLRVASDCARPRRSPRRRSRPWRTSGRWPASCSTARPTIRRRGSGSWAATAPRRRSPRRARPWPAPSRSTWRPWRPRSAASSSVSA